LICSKKPTLVGSRVAALRSSISFGILKKLMLGITLSKRIYSAKAPGLP